MTLKEELEQVRELIKNTASRLDRRCPLYLWVNTDAETWQLDTDGADDLEEVNGQNLMKLSGDLYDMEIELAITTLTDHAITPDHVYDMKGFEIDAIQSDYEEAIASAWEILEDGFKTLLETLNSRWPEADAFGCNRDCAPLLIKTNKIFGGRPYIVYPPDIIGLVAEHGRLPSPEEFRVMLHKNQKVQRARGL